MPARPKSAPKHIPKWAWSLYSWLGKKPKLRGKRPVTPKKLPDWYWTWRAWREGAKKLPKPAPNKPIKPPEHHPLSFNQRVVAYCHTSLAYAGRMRYTMSSARSVLFHRKPGDFDGASADCSQYGASIMSWCGNKLMTAYDATGSLWNKGKVLGGPRAGCGVIFGAYPGEHFAFATEEVDGVWYCVGFGHQGAPNRSTLTYMKAYFEAHGHPGVRFIDFTP